MNLPSASRRLAKLMALAFFVYGGWAGCANASHGAFVAARSFLVQGFSSATTTLLMGAVIEALRARVGKGFFRELVPSVVATLAATCFHVSLHLLARTPEIARTVAPSVIAGLLFSLVYSRFTRGPGSGGHGSESSATEGARVPSSVRDDIEVRRYESSTLEPSELEEIWEFYRQFVQRPKGPFLDAVRATDTVYIGRERGSGQVRAFAAAKVVEIEWGGHRHAVLFNAWSGVDPAFRGGNIIQRAGLETFLRYRMQHPLRPVYFAMTASTYKSYLLMTRNFAQCFPHRKREMPARERAILDAAVRATSASGWDAEAGVVRRHGALRYTEGVVADEGVQTDLDIVFYGAQNPLQHEGDSLACIAPLSAKNWLFMGLKGARAEWGRRIRSSRAPRERDLAHEPVRIAAGS